MKPRVLRAKGRALSGYGATLPIYNVGINVFFDSDDMVDHSRLDHVKDKVNDCHGCCFAVGHDIYIFLKSKSANTVTHEVTHAVFEVYRHSGIVLDIDNQEPFAYLAGVIGQFVVDCIYKHEEIKGKGD